MIGVAPEVEVLLSRAADGVAVAVVTPPGHERTAAMFLGYAAGLDDFEFQRFRLLASLTSTRLVVVETPGHGTHASRLLPAERRALRHSDLGPLAGRLDATATEAVGAQPEIVVGYSMGASTAAAAARERSVHGAAPAAGKAARTRLAGRARHRDRRQHLVPAVGRRAGAHLDGTHAHRPGVDQPHSACRQLRILLGMTSSS